MAVFVPHQLLVHPIPCLYDFAGVGDSSDACSSYVGTLEQGLCVVLWTAPGACTWQPAHFYRPQNCAAGKSPQRFRLFLHDVITDFTGNFLSRALVGLVFFFFALSTYLENTLWFFVRGQAHEDPEL